MGGLQFVVWFVLAVEFAPQAIAFTCLNSGTYPDPYDCHKYHVCGINSEKEETCPNSMVYSVISEVCVPETMFSNLCSPQYECNMNGQMGAWPGENNIFYICMDVMGVGTYYPILNRCPQDFVFNGQKCVSKEVWQCSNRFLEANPNDCRSYTRCIDGRIIAEQCPSGTRFNSAKSMCEFGDC